MDQACRILIAANEDHKGEGRHATALSRTLVARGHSVAILVPGPRWAGCDVAGNPAKIVWPSRRPVHLRDAMFFARVVRRYRPTHIIANFGAVNVAMLVGWLARVPSRISWYRTLSTQIDLDSTLPHWRMQLVRRRKRLVYGLATDIVANSQATADDAFTVFRLRPEKLHVFPNELADPGIQPIARQDGEQRVVCVGRLHHSKGQDLLLRATARLAAQFPQLRVEFVGNGPAREEFADLARELGITNVCSFLGSAAHEEVLAKMSGAVATVVPSRAEAFGRVNIESLAVGTPLVGARTGGIAEIVRDGVDGFLFPPEDTAALADCLRRLLTDSQLQTSFSRNARAHYLQVYESGVVLTAQARWLEELGAARRSGGATSSRR